MVTLVGFFPVLLFVALYIGGGLYNSFNGVPNPFYQLPAVVMIIPAIIAGYFLNKKPSSEEKIKDFIDGVRHKDIINMILIFLLAGAFSEVSKSIGSVDATVNLALNLIPSKFLLIGIFLIAAFISTAIGTSMGTIAAIGSIAAGISEKGGYPMDLGMATVVGGAMFGDSLSIISDTTIAAVNSQNADLRKKLKLNAFVAITSGLLTIAILLFIHNGSCEIASTNFSFILTLPYIFLVVVSFSGVNVFFTLMLAIIFTGLIGMLNDNFSITCYAQNISKGFISMSEIVFLSLMVGGLHGLSLQNISSFNQLITGIIKGKNSYKLAQLLIAKIVSIFDIMIANNTIAIILSGELAKDISKKYKIPPHYTATWLDTFSCVFQGIIPYGAQILLASSIGKISPLAIMTKVYFCYFLFIVCIFYIIFNKKKDHQI
jgi:Na+/H+ antiporter NhaC